MPGVRPSNTAKGDRAEYFAQYLLSFIGLPLPVLRQLDIGIDFICNISENDNNLTKYSHPFSVQLKVLNENTKETSDPISYGGFNNSKKNKKWKKYEIEWLFNPGIPSFIGILDALNHSLFLYSTSSIWFAYHHEKIPTQIILVPRIHDDNFKDVHSPRITPFPFKKGEVIQHEGDGQTHHIDLGQPIVTLNLKDINNEEYVQSQKDKLKNIINKVEQRNIIQKNLDSSFFWWNKHQDTLNIAWYLNPWSPRFNPEKLKEELVPILVPLAIFYKNMQLNDELKEVASILRHVKDYVPKEIKNDLLKEVFT